MSNESSSTGAKNNLGLAAYITGQVTGNPETMTIARRVAARSIAAHLPRERRE
jgi:hypothetical protein